MTRRQLTGRVEGFGVKSKDVRIGVVVKKGFERNDFEDVWKRYLPATTPAATATTLQPSNHKALSDFSNATQVTSVAKQNTRKASSSEACSVVADQKAVQHEDNTAEYF